jgi:adenine deaminase
MAPSCVPATHLETAGAELLPPTSSSSGPRAGHRPGEMMNFPGVLYRVPPVLDKLGLPAAGRWTGTLRACRPGPERLRGGRHPLGPRSTGLEEAREKLRRGMHVMIREGPRPATWRQLLPLVTPANARLCHFCTDDRHPDTLLARGTSTTSCARPSPGAWIRSGHPDGDHQHRPVLSPATRGAVAPGYRADLLVLDDLEGMAVAQVYAGAAGGRGGPVPAARRQRPPRALRFQHARRPRRPRFCHPGRARGRRGSSASSPSRSSPRTCAWSPRWRTAWSSGSTAATCSRWRSWSGTTARATYRPGPGARHAGCRGGPGLQRGPRLAQHRRLRRHRPDMRTAVEGRRRDGRRPGRRRCWPGAGRLPAAHRRLDVRPPLERSATRWQRWRRPPTAWDARCPTRLMTLSFLALPVIPALKLTDRGLVDVSRFDFVPLLWRIGQRSL